MRLLVKNPQNKARTVLFSIIHFAVSGNIHYFALTSLLIKSDKPKRYTIWIKNLVIH